MMKNSNFLVVAGLVALGLGSLTPTSVQAQSAKPSMARAITLTGIVGGAPMAREFFLRANGETFRVQPLPAVGMSGIRGGDRVRVFGRPTGLIISHANVRVLTSRASDSPSDYNPGPTTTIQRQPSRRNGGPARSTTIQTTPVPSSNQGMTMPNNGNRRPINRPVQGIVTPGVVTPGVVTPGVVTPGVVAPGFVGPGVVTSGVINSGIVTPGVVTPGVVVPGSAASNAIRQNIIKQGQTN